ncbi:MAG: hypothetical protein K5877_07800, partial [Lachnospiraceae bacterium]|nr:hypothetical protein [Lachnospiraceae bacterium]
MPLTQQQYTKLKDLLEVARQLQSEDRMKDNTDYVDALLRQTSDPVKQQKLTRLKEIFSYKGSRYRDDAAELIRELDSLMTYKNGPQFQNEHVEMMNKLKNYFSPFDGYYDTLNEVLENADGYDVLHDKHSTFTRHVVPSVTRLSNLYGEF